MKRLISGFTLFILTLSVFATHERAGEITFKHIDGLTFEITIITYTYAPSPADRPELEVKWGDGTSSIIKRIEVVDFPNDVRRNVYSYDPAVPGSETARHTFPGASTYTISLEDPNRNAGVLNIPNSVNVPLYTQTQLVINPILGINNSPVLLNPPLEYGCVDRLYIHNPGAIDPDGDSLSYSLTVCRGEDGLPIPGYKFPDQVNPGPNNNITMDPLTGDFIWDSPQLKGEYNIAILIEEWRNGQKIGSITRDMQIIVEACDNFPPEITPVPDTCILAGETLNISITASDPDTTLVLSLTGDPFLEEDSPAVFIYDPAISDSTGTFVWETKCSHIRQSDYTVYIKAVDNDVPISLTAFSSFRIKVVAPPPLNLDAAPLGNAITLQWEPPVCDNGAGYDIYRRAGQFGFVPGHCETGVPAYTGFQYIGSVSPISNTTYVDDNNGLGLIHGVDYCYLVTARFEDGAESYASNEACAALKKDIPVLTNVSVENTGTNNGEIYVAWSKPTELDTVQVPGPYEYRLMRAEGTSGTEFVQVATFDNLNDTIYYDNGMNTEEKGWSYKIDFYNIDPDNFFFIGSSAPAPSVFLTTEPTDQKLILNWNINTPWFNEYYDIFQIDGDTTYIGTAGEPEFSVTGLTNGVEYCFLIVSMGDYSTPGFISPLINNSQIACGMPVDNQPPCSPELLVATNCDTYNNELSWFHPNNCLDSNDIDISYNIYYSPTLADDLLQIESTPATTFQHIVYPPTITGCYAVTAVDSVGNESEYSNTVCIDIDSCSLYRLPNVFTPNGDARNDYFVPIENNSVQKIDITIFNRWGKIVFDEKDWDPMINWDGRDMDSGEICSEGVYFYILTAYELTLNGLMERELKGSLTLLK